MSFTEEIAEIETRLSEAGKSVSWMCSQLGVARSTWQRWKSGRTEPRLATWRAAVAICEGLPATADSAEEDAA